MNIKSYIINRSWSKEGGLKEYNSVSGRPILTYPGSKIDRVNRYTIERDNSTKSKY